MRALLLGFSYVAPHRQSNADGTQRNNWSTKGTANPSTGRAGTKTAHHKGQGWTRVVAGTTIVVNTPRLPFASVHIA